MPNNELTGTSEKIATLIRIFRAAAIAKDEPLRLSALAELAKYGIRSADLAVKCEVKHD